MPAIAAMAGYDALVINRIDHKLKSRLKERAAMEFVWKPYVTPLAVESSSEADEATAPSYTEQAIFTHVLHTHYSAPKGFDFENPEGVPISDGNVHDRARIFASEMRQRARAYRTTHLLVPFGDDFKFQDAGNQFRNMDALIRHFKAKSNDPSAGHISGMEVRYSTLSEYFNAVHAEAAPGGAAPVVYFPLLEAAEPDGGVDFFPYADNDNSWWVGYYTSRPLLKQLIRRSFNILRGADALMVWARPYASLWQQAADGVVSLAAGTLNSSLNNPDNDGPKLSMEEETALKSFVAAGAASSYQSFSWFSTFQRIEQSRLDAALCLHHDAITGTSKQSVVEDYTMRMAEGIKNTLAVITDLSSLILGGIPKAMATRGKEPEALLGSGHSLGPAPLTHVPHVLPVLDALQLDSASEGRISPATAAHPVVVYNPSSWNREAIITVLVDIGSVLSDLLAKKDAQQLADPAELCKFYTLPIATVVDDKGMPMEAQWLTSTDSKVSLRRLQHIVKALGTDKLSCMRVDPQSCSVRNVWQAAFALPTEAWADVRTAITDFVSTLRFELAFKAHVAALSLATYFVSVGWHTAASTQVCDMQTADLPSYYARPGRIFLPTVALSQEALQTANNKLMLDTTYLIPVDPNHPKGITLENACLRISVDPHSGLLQGVTYKHPAGSKDAQNVDVKQSFGVYKTWESGAYLFRPVAAPVPLEQSLGAEADVTVSVSSEAMTKDGTLTGLVQTVQVAGAAYSQHLRLVDSLGFHRGSDFTGLDLQAVCSDPLLPDSMIDIRPTVHAGGNEELVALFDINLDIQTERSHSPNLRDQSESYQPADQPSQCLPAPVGWWTGDGIGLLRRKPAPPDVSTSNIREHFYPMNVLSRVSGNVRESSDVSGVVTLFTAQPFGTTTRAHADGTVRMEIMLHRHLLQDDGRGLATGVLDNTELTARLGLSVTAYSGLTNECAAQQRLSHEEWTWTWGVRSAVHHQQFVTMHADLADIHRSGVAGIPIAPTLLRYVHPAGEGAPNAAKLNAVRAEAPIPRQFWLDNYATSFHGSHAGIFRVATHHAEETQVKCSGELKLHPRSQQMCRYVDKMLSATTDVSFPPWVEVITLQVRDGITDDVVLRFRNFGGPEVEARVSSILGDTADNLSGDANLALSVSSWSPRSLTLSHHEAYLRDKLTGVQNHRHRLHFPSTNDITLELAAKAPDARNGVFDLLRLPDNRVLSTLASFSKLCGANFLTARILSNGGKLDGSIVNQNTNEEGVFISDAAEKMRQQGRKLLEAEARTALDVDSFSLPPDRIRSFVVAVDVPYMALSRSQSSTLIPDADALSEKIIAVVLNLEERQEMLLRVSNGLPLTKSQEARLTKLERKSPRIHTQTAPSNLEEILQTHITPTQAPLHVVQSARNPWMAEDRPESDLHFLVDHLHTKRNSTRREFAKDSEGGELVAAGGQVGETGSALDDEITDDLVADFRQDNSLSGLAISVIVLAFFASIFFCCGGIGQRKQARQSGNGLLPVHADGDDSYSNHETLFSSIVGSIFGARQRNAIKRIMPGSKAS
jgi:hypothetical protein